jgi:hypothetical protein
LYYNAGIDEHKGVQQPHPFRRELSTARSEVAKLLTLYASVAVGPVVSKFGQNGTQISFFDGTLCVFSLTFSFLVSRIPAAIQDLESGNPTCDKTSEAHLILASICTPTSARRGPF